MRANMHREEEEIYGKKEYGNETRGQRGKKN